MTARGYINGILGSFGVSFANVIGWLQNPDDNMAILHALITIISAIFGFIMSYFTIRKLKAETEAIELKNQFEALRLASVTNGENGTDSK